MSEFTIFHNPRCSKSRQTLALLEENNIQPDIRLYLETPPSNDELASILQTLGMSPRALLRKGEADYKALSLSNTDLENAELIEAMVKHPKLIERPIVIKGDRAVLGRPPENVLELL
jgi:arsenate reductase